MNISSRNNLRLFIAFELPADAKRHLAHILEQLKVESAAGGVSPRAIKWVDADSIHLTTQFLGDIESHRVKAIEEAVSNTYSQFDKRALVLESRKIGAFPNLNRPRVIWADLSGEDLMRMKQVTSSLSDRLIEIGILAEAKPFKPHLTLGRFRRDSTPQSLQAIVVGFPIEPIQIVFDTLTLFASELTPRGPIHTALKSWRFVAS